MTAGPAASTAEAGAPGGDGPRRGGARAHGSAGRQGLVPAISRVAGDALITVGVVLLLFCAYQLGWTNVEAARAQDAVTEELTESWAVLPPAGGASPARETAGEGPEQARPGGEGDPAAPAGPAPLEAPDPGEPFALLHVPRLGSGHEVPLLEGTRRGELARGVGHYVGTAMPGERGNFAVAGHRATNGEPFRDLDRLRPGDPVVVEGPGGWWTYVVERSQIVRPSDVEVIAPVPGRPGEAPGEAWMTLTTCHPRWSSEQRLVVTARLSEARTRADGPPPALEG